MDDTDTQDVAESDRLCNIECLKEGKVEEFAGPIRVILSDPPVDGYCKRKIASALLTLANIMIGATTISMLWFAARPNSYYGYVGEPGRNFESYNNMHIACCTVGFQICMAHGILMLQSLNGPAARLMVNHRRCQHWSLHIFGLGAGIAGTYVTYKKSVVQRESKQNVHVYCGWATIGLTGVATLIGLCLFSCDNKPTPRCLTMIHRLFGVSAYITSSVCFCLAFRKPRFLDNLYDSSPVHVCNMLTFCCIFYSVIVIFTPIINFCRKNN